MLPRRFEASLVLAICLAARAASAAEPGDDDTAGVPSASPDTSDEAPAPKPRAAKLPAAKPPADADAEPTAQPPPDTTVAVKPPEQPTGWRTEVSGYFRAPMALGISSRPGPDNPTGPPSTQVSYGPNRTVDANYYSFAYTRLQEQDWAELFIHAKKKHVDAAVGWMGYWFQSVGFRNYDAGWAPCLAYVALDTDFGDADLKPNIAFTAGAFWPSFGYFEKYDTYTLGRFRQLGAQLKLMLPITSDLTGTGWLGFGTGRDGQFNPGAPPFYGATTALDLLAYAHGKVSYAKILDIGVHLNTEWTADPNLAQQSAPDPKSYAVEQAAHLSVFGAELNLRVPRLGHLWISPSFISVRNGWALKNAGTEVMHSLSGNSLVTNYFSWTNNPDNSTGTGSMVNLGFLYENTLSGIQGNAPGSVPDVTLSIFGLLADTSRVLPAGSNVMPAGSTALQTSLKQFKYGADLTLQSLTWLGFMLRGDFVNYDLDPPGYVFASITPRVIISSHFLSTERIYLQYSRYTYGDKMTL